MNKEDLIAMGLTEEQAKKVMDSLDGNFVTKARFNEVNEENKTLKKSVSDRDKQLEDLKKSSGDNAELKKQIEALQQQNADQKKTHETEMNQLKLDNAVETALTAAGARNTKAVRSLLDVSKLKLGDDGKPTGFDEQLKAIQESDPYLFEEKQQTQQNNFRGFQPGASSDVKPGAKVDFSKMTYSEMAAYMAANPDAKIE
ncbi:phage scaffolding protein [Porcipelethomonas sp.]|uniref:phage scaffolding protein n=1 Tax=Porcipelethomonas sp. TaxID=2981675 RepID=UPI003EF89A68